MAPALASYLLSIPLFIHEQNSVPGLVNRILNRLSKKTFEAFPGSFDKSSKIHTVGNPVRPEINKNPEDKPTIKDLFNFCDEKNINIKRVIGVNENQTSSIKRNNLEIKNLFSKLGIFLIG